MGIPIGKLDLYTVCAGFDPGRTIPLLLDAGCSGPEANSAHLNIRDDELYTGLKMDRVKHTSAAGALSIYISIHIYISIWYIYGCSGPEVNSARLNIRDDSCYTGLKMDCVKHTSAAGTI